MASDEGRQAWGWLVGSGDARGMALLFIAASVCMAVIVFIAFRTKSYRWLSDKYAHGKKSTVGAAAK